MPWPQAGEAANQDQRAGQKLRGVSSEAQHLSGTAACLPEAEACLPTGRHTSTTTWGQSPSMKGWHHASMLNDCACYVATSVMPCYGFCDLEMLFSAGQKGIRGCAACCRSDRACQAGGEGSCALIYRREQPDIHKEVWDRFPSRWDLE